MKFEKFPHHITKKVNDKSLQVFWSKSAEREFLQRSQPLIVEMELKCACMVRMLVHFHNETDNPNVITINDHLQVFYYPVIGQACDLSERGNVSNPPEMVEITKGPMAGKYPKKLGIDFVKGEWIGSWH